MDDDRRRPVPPLRREAIREPDMRDVRLARRRTNLQLIRWRRLPGRGRYKGVCAGLAYRFGWRPWKMRLAFILGTLLLGGMPIAYYLLAAMVVPARKRLPHDFDEKTGSKDS